MSSISANAQVPPKRRVRESFDRSAASYDAAAVLQRRVCERLLAGCTPRSAPASILDAGCGTGFGARLLHKRWPAAAIVGVDFAPRMLSIARHEAAVCVAADIEALPFADQRFALWWSSLTVQWCDLRLALAEARRVLQPGGEVALSTLGPETFRELREAFVGVDNHRHTLGFSEPEAVSRALAQAGFSAISVQREAIELHYVDLQALLRAVKEIGANSVGDEGRRGMLGRHAWQRVQAAYEQHRTAAGLPARYDVILAYARK